MALFFIKAPGAVLRAAGSSSLCIQSVGSCPPAFLELSPGGGSPAASQISAASLLLHSLFPPLPPLSPRSPGSHHGAKHKLTPVAALFPLPRGPGMLPCVKPQTKGLPSREWWPDTCAVLAQQCPGLSRASDSVFRLPPPLSEAVDRYCPSAAC